MTDAIDHEIARLNRELESAKQMIISALVERDALRAQVGELMWEKEQEKRKASLKGTPT